MNKKTIIIFVLVLVLTIGGYFGFSQYTLIQNLAQKKTEALSFVNNFKNINDVEKDFRVKKLDKIGKLSIDNYDWLGDISIVEDYNGIVKSINKVQNLIPKSKDKNLLEISNIINAESKAINQVNNFSPTIECLFKAELNSKQFEGGMLYFIRNRKNPNRNQNPKVDQVEKVEDTQARLITNHQLFKTCNVNKQNTETYQKLADYLENYADKHLAIPLFVTTPGKKLEIMNEIEYSTIADELDTLKKQYQASFEFSLNRENSPAYLQNLALENNSKINTITSNILESNNIIKNLKTGILE